MSLFTLKNINKIEIDDGSGTVVGVCGVTGGLKVGGTGEYTHGLSIDTSGGGVVINSSSYQDVSGTVSFNSSDLIDIKDLSANGDITLTASTGTSNLINLGTTGDTIRFYEGTGNYYDFPFADGSANQVLKTDGSGTLSFATISGGTSGATSINGLTDAYADSTNVVLGNENAEGTTGRNNTGIGVCALYDLASGFGSENVAVGRQALQNITDGSSNIAIGATALAGNTLASNNIAIGHNTLYQYTGNVGDNTVVGSNSGSGITSSGVSGLTIIGASSGVGLTSASSNLTLIGYQVETQGTDTSNTVYIGNGQVGKVYMQGNVLVTSDGRDKTDVEDSSYGLNIVDNLRPVEFTWDRRPIVPGDAENTTNGQRSVGLIAQEVRDSLTEEENKILNLVNDSSEERFHMCYNNLIPILVKAVKDLKSEVDTLKQRMDACSC